MGKEMDDPVKDKKRKLKSNGTGEICCNEPLSFETRSLNSQNVSEDF
jgi:hypothetical protein